MSSEEKKETPVEAPEVPAAPDVPEATETPADDADDGAGPAQIDGAGEVPGNGNPIQDVAFDVEVKLADMQADPNNPLFSAKSFEELKL
jgi:ATP-dependent RNA helicase DDX19/DBP5